MTIWPSCWEVTLHNNTDEATQCTVRGIRTRQQCHQQSNWKSTSVYDDHNISTLRMPAEHLSSEAVQHNCIRRCIGDDVVSMNMVFACTAQCPDQQCTSVGRTMQWLTRLNCTGGADTGLMKNQTNAPPASNKIKTDTRMLSNRMLQVSRSQAHAAWCCAITVDWHDSNCYLQCGVAGAPEQWKWTFCHRPLYRCQTRVSSVCWVTGTPDLLHQ